MIQTDRKSDKEEVEKDIPKINHQGYKQEETLSIN